MSVEVRSFFFDTNVIVYAYDLAMGEKYKIASALVQEHWSGTGSLSMQVLQEFYVTVTQKIRKPIDSQPARQIVADLAKWSRHVPEIDDILSAIDIQQELHIAFWDAMIVQSAFSLGCDTIYSEDFNPTRTYGGIKVINPFL